MQFLDKLKKFTFQILNFLLYKNLEIFQVNWEFFQPIVKKIGTVNWTQLCI